MESLKKLIAICNEFKKSVLGIEEFQQRIETILLPDECKHTLEKHQRNACNRLEEIMYCYFESQKKYADEVADSLIQATITEQKRLQCYSPYYDLSS
jgi:hypothetical protein